VTHGTRAGRRSRCGDWSRSRGHARAGRPCPRNARRQPCRPSRRSPLPVYAGDKRPVRADVGVAGQPADAPCFGKRVRGPDDHLARYTSPVGAFPADQSRFDAHRVKARFGQAAGDVLSAQAEPHHDHVSVCTIVDPSYRSQRTALWTDSLRRSRTSFLKPPAFGAVGAIAGGQASLEDHHRRGWLGQDSPSSSIRTARVGRHRGEARAGVAGWATLPKSQSAVSAGRWRWSFWMCCSSACTAGFTSATGGVVLRVVRPFRCVQSFRGISHDLAGQHGADPARRTP
jgi:hypothetical protein